MASWMRTQTAAPVDRPYALFFRTLLGEASEAEIEERYVALARVILDGESDRKNDA